MLFDVPLIFVVCFVSGIFLATVSPDVAGGDSGELVAASCVLGHAHPPGYPFFTLANYLFIRFFPRLLAVGSPAWRANVFNGACTVGAASCLALSVRRWAASLPRRGAVRQSCSSLHVGAKMRSHGSGWAGACAALLYALSPLVWLYGAGAEVFALNNLMCSSIVCAALRYASMPPGLGSDRAVVVGAFLCGLALCNQHTAVLFEIPFILWIFGALVRCGRLSLPFLSALATAFATGLLPQVYLPVQSIFFSRQTDWGDSSSPGPSRFRRVLSHIGVESGAQTPSSSDQISAPL